MFKVWANLTNRSFDCVVQTLNEVVYIQCTNIHFYSSDELRNALAKYKNTTPDDEQIDKV